MLKRSFSVVSLFVAAAMALAACAPAPAAFTPPTDPLGLVQIPKGEPLHIAFWGVL